jgi:hypothetical protein
MCVKTLPEALALGKRLPSVPVSVFSGQAMRAVRLQLYYWLRPCSMARDREIRVFRVENGGNC